MKTLYAHQQRFIDKNPDNALLVWEGGLGKTYAACLWIKARKNKKALVVCPKAIIKKWIAELKEAGANADVVSRDYVKQMDLSMYSAIVIDEAQDFAAPLFDTGRSQRATVIYNFVRSNAQANMLLLTATPIRSTPWNIHTLATYVRHFWPVKDFKDRFFYLTDKFGRYHFEKKPHWQRSIRPYVEEIAEIVLMSECTDVPIQHHQVLTIEWTDEQEDKVKALGLAGEPVKLWHERHRAEQGDAKFKELQTILDKYRKVIVVCEYRSQIDDYVKRIGSDRQVFVLNGSVKDQDAVIKEAQEADDCVFIIQASMGAGFDADQFSIVVFASMSFKYVDYAQMKYRVKRIHNLHENTFIHMLGGKCDQAVYNTIQENRDFDVHEYLRKN
jgi:superfamily II DNA or RNA helicase